MTTRKPVGAGSDGFGGIELQTRENVYGRHRTRPIRIDLQQLGLTVSGLIGVSLAAMEQPAHNSLVCRIRTVLRLVTSHPQHGREIRALLSEQPSNLTTLDIWRLFALCEECIAQREAAGVWASGYAYSSLLRAAVMDCPAPLRGGAHIRMSVSFVTRFEEQSAIRFLISETPDPHSPDTRYRAPVQETRHSSYAELKEKIGDHLEYRLNRIVAAAWDVVEGFWKSRDAFLQYTEPFTLPAGAVDHIESLLPKSLSRSAYRELRRYSPAQLLRAYAEIARRRELFAYANWRRWSHANHLVLADDFSRNVPIVARYAISSRQITNVVLCEWLLPPYVLYAALIILLERAAWNPTTVLGLCPSQIERLSDGCIELHPLKFRNDSYSPYKSPADDNRFRKLIDELLAHHAVLHKHWELDADGPLLAVATMRGVPQAVLPGHIHKRFIEEYSLPKFTLRQIRDQDLSKLFVRTDNPELVKVRAMHANLEMTSTYLRRTTLRLMNRANINEYQKRFAATAVFAIAGSTEAKRRGYIVRDVDQKLFETGNGLLCAAPMQGPVGCVGQDGLCRAELCGECDNVRVIVTESRIREAILAKTHYTTHFQRYVEVAPGVLNENRLRMIEYTVALCEFMKSSEAAGAYFKIESELRAEGLLNG